MENMYYSDHFPGEFTNQEILCKYLQSINHLNIVQNQYANILTIRLILLREGLDGVKQFCTLGKNNYNSLCKLIPSDDINEPKVTSILVPGLSGCCNQEFDIEYNSEVDPSFVTNSFAGMGLEYISHINNVFHARGDNYFNLFKSLSQFFSYYYYTLERICQEIKDIYDLETSIGREIWNFGNMNDSDVLANLKSRGYNSVESLLNTITPLKKYSHYRHKIDHTGNIPIDLPPDTYDVLISDDPDDLTSFKVRLVNKVDSIYMELLIFINSIYGVFHSDIIASKGNIPLA